MTIPSNLGKWLLETMPSDDELDEFMEEWDSNELIDALIRVLDEWDDLIQNQSPATANWLIWKIFSYPFFLPHEKLTDDQIASVAAGCERITLSIPRIHPANQPMENGFFMLWDLFAEDDQTSFDALSRLVEHPDERVQYAALHGLGHRGNARIPIIQKYIKKHPDMLDDDFVKECLAGEVM